MLKASLLASLFASLAMGAALASNVNAPKAAERDARIIVEIDSGSNLTEEGYKNTQDTMMNEIRTYATSNFSLYTRFHRIGNAFVIDVNSASVDAIRNLPGVKSVTLDKVHWETTVPTQVENEGVVEKEDSSEIADDGYGGSSNVSAETMYKPENTEDGEGTTIAILDNEFYFRADENDPEAGWHHETFSALDADVAVKHTGLPAGYTSTHAYAYQKEKGKTGATLGTEGSLYFNSKVPFYFDYGGERVHYGDSYSQDFDVSSEITYHGSHVASIAAGNAPTYKGIAPKAQLICMKVFTNYKASGLDALLGLSGGSGAYDVPILSALEDCLELGVDGINMSLGSDLDDFDADSITLKTLTKLVNQGVMTSISAGNAGKAAFSSVGTYANWTRDVVETGILGSYANNKSVMSIASGQPDRIFYESAFKLDDGTNIAYEDQIVNREGYGEDYKKEFRIADLLNGDPEKTLDWVYVSGFGTAADYTENDSYYEGKIVVVNRGSTSFSDKYTVAKSKMAAALVVINNDPTSNDFNFRMSFGDGFKPTMPCALVLFKDKGIFESAKSGSFHVMSKQVDINPNTKTISSYSSDGATYDLDLKPEITAPGENIRGAVPPQKKEDRQERPLKTYEFLSGTSMSAPNYAGVQSVLLSSKAAPIYRAAKNAGRSSLTKGEQTEIANYRKTVNMRLMSTAVPMTDVNENPETKVKTITSPRRQGAGMVNMTKALNTSVYLEGLDSDGATGLGKSKITLKNNNKINNGTIAIKFIGHNTGTSNKSYNVTLSVMRPAIAKTTDIVTKDYNDRGEISEIESFTGYTYWVVQGLGEHAKNVQKTAPGSFAHKDVYKVSKPIEYYATEEDLIAGRLTTIEIGRYYNAGDDKVVDWQPMPTNDYQSVSDVLIETVSLGTITMTPGDKTYTLNEHTLSAEVKADIASKFEYGTYIEGFVSFEDKDLGGVDLSMPYLGFYSNDGQSYQSAPVAEPFTFEKNLFTVYPSDLVNATGKELLGKEKIDMSSLWVAGYVEPGQGVNTDDILANDNNFANLPGFYRLGTDAATGQYFSKPANNLYVGNAYNSNTMIVQQFMLRSVKDNYFTITNKATNEQVYKSALSDMLFGDYWNTNPLYKSHIDTNYFSAGYLGHRAYAVIPLYNPETGESFASGDYTITFNYLLAGTGRWTSMSYTLHVDNDVPEVEKLEFTNDGVDITIKDASLASAVVGQYIKDFRKSGSGRYIISLTSEELEQTLKGNINNITGEGRLFIGLRDQAHGYSGAVVKFYHNATVGPDRETGEGVVEQITNDDISYTMIQHPDLELTNDFKINSDGSIVVSKQDIKSGRYNVVQLNGKVKLTNGNYNATTTTTTTTTTEIIEHIEEKTIVVNDCGGNVMTTSITLSAIAGIAFVLLFIATRKKRKGGKI